MNRPLTLTDPSGFEAKKTAAESQAATESTQLAEKVSSTEISSQDSVDGEEGKTTEQVDDYYTDVDGYAQLNQTQRPAEQHSGAEKPKIPGHLMTPPDDINDYGLAGKEFMESGIDPAEGNHDKFAAKEDTKAEQYTQETQISDTTSTCEYQTAGNNTVARATGSDPSYRPPDTYQPPVISASKPGSRREDPVIQPMSANEFFQTQHLTLGAPVSSPQMATVNSLFITGAVVGNLAPVIAPAVAESSLSISAAAAASSPVSIPTTIRFVEGFVGPTGPTSDPVTFLGEQTRQVVEEAFRQ